MVALVWLFARSPDAVTGMVPDFWFGLWQGGADVAAMLPPLPGSYYEVRGPIYFPLV